ncbi:MAG TPA: hypothetical protein PK467_18035, partial [Candidatus Wallbacteria bacterium]|nr:hypothetical protein [Candidatus Wallbacteria bacterium]
MEIIWFETENSSMFVSMANYGITFSAEVIKSMGNPEYVKMGYSIEKRKIIVKICDVDDPMKLEFKGRNKRNYVRIASKFFIKFIK